MAKTHSENTPSAKTQSPEAPSTAAGNGEYAQEPCADNNFSPSNTDHGEGMDPSREQIDKLNELLTHFIRTRKDKGASKTASVTFRLNDADKQLLDLLAEWFGLSQADLVSLLLRFYTPDLLTLKNKVESNRVDKIQSALKKTKAIQQKAKALVPA